VSLVEKALQKMRSAAPTAPELGNLARRPAVEALPEVGKVVPAVAVPAAPPPPAVVEYQRTDKVVNVNPRMLRSAGLMPEEAEARRVDAEYRQIKRPLIAAARGRGAPAVPNGRAIMIASALPGEGKTFTSVNLALSIALENDTSVLLVDGDLAKSHVSRAFEVKDEPGLMDLLADESRDPASVILRTTVRGLSLMPAGRDSATATELLASQRMESVVAGLLERDPNLIVLFDSPPLLLTSESRVLISVVGQIVVVVRAEETTHQAVREALNQVATVTTEKPVGLILNQCQTSRSHGYYGYYGDYGQSSNAG
jgi:protein-tyrosine kinase